jgi:molecular chaperone DnaK
MIDKLIIETKDHIVKALKEAGVSANEIDEVIMVGGSTRVPKAQQMFQKCLMAKS